MGNVVDGSYGMFPESAKWRYCEEFPQQVSGLERQEKIHAGQMNKNICIPSNTTFHQSYLNSEHAYYSFVSKHKQWSKGNVRIQSQFMDGHSLLGSCHWMAQLQIRGKERIGESAYSREGNQGCRECARR